MSAREIAQRIGFSVAWFYEHRKKLEAGGMPKRDDLLGGWHRSAIERWLAIRAGEAPTSPPSAKDRLRKSIDAHANALRHSQN